VGNTASKERIFGLAGVGRKLGEVPIGDGYGRQARVGLAWGFGMDRSVVLVT
jgi:hypothetical protein